MEYKGVEDKGMATGLIFAICVLIFVFVSVLTAILVYKSQMRKKRLQWNSQEQTQDSNRGQNQ